MLPDGREETEKIDTHEDAWLNRSSANSRSIGDRQCSAAGSFDRGHELAKLLLVQMVIGPHAGTQIKSKRPNRANGFTDVPGSQPAREKNGDD
mgnify:FL=1